MTDAVMRVVCMRIHSSKNSDAQWRIDQRDNDKSDNKQNLEKVTFDLVCSPMFACPFAKLSKGT